MQIMFNNGTSEVSILEELCAYTDSRKKREAEEQRTGVNKRLKLRVVEGETLYASKIDMPPSLPEDATLAAPETSAAVSPLPK